MGEGERVKKSRKSDDVIIDGPCCINCSSSRKRTLHHDERLGMYLVGRINTKNGPLLIYQPTTYGILGSRVIGEIQRVL